MKLVFQVFGILLLAFYPNSAFDTSSHAPCRAPRPTVIGIDAPRYRYYPYFVIAHRCGGSCPTSPKTQYCAAFSYDDITVDMFDRWSAKSVKVPIKNHTSCGCRCVSSAKQCRPEVQTWAEDKCRCQCKYPVAPPEHLACKPDFRWDSNHCVCTCDKPPQICPVNKEWSRESCACICTSRVVKRCERKQKGLDYESCQCIDVQALRRDPTTHPQSRMFITLLVIQGFVLVVIICVLIHFVRKSRRHSTDYSDDQPSPKSLPSRSDSGIISCSNNTLSNVAFANGKSTCNENHGNSNASVHVIDSRESTI